MAQESEAHQVVEHNVNVMNKIQGKKGCYKEAESCIEFAQNK